ncbi:MAG: heavy-metal-associated domain-containing protein [Bacteroidota bacterium]
MENQIFNTNINCSSCVAKVTNTLNEVVGEGNWEVDTNQATKPLTIKNNSVSSNEIIESIEKIGFKAIAQ